MSNKLFAERLNKELDSIGLPPKLSERIETFSKMVRIPKFKAEAFLSGIIRPDEKLLSLIATELEVNADWLMGKSDQKHKKTHA